MTAVRYQGIIHDFVMVNALRGTNAASAAIAQAVDYLCRALGTDAQGDSKPVADTCRPPASPPSTGVATADNSRRSPYGARVTAAGNQRQTSCAEVGPRT